METFFKGENMKTLILIGSLVIATMGSQAFACSLPEVIDVVIAHDGINASNKSVNATGNSIQVSNTEVIIYLVSMTSAEGSKCSRLMVCDPSSGQYEFLARQCGN